MKLRLYKFTLFYGVTWLLCTKSQKEKLNSYRLVFDATRPTDSPLMGSQASVTKHVSWTLMVCCFLKGIYFISYRQTSIFPCVHIRGDFMMFFEISWICLSQNWTLSKRNRVRRMHFYLRLYVKDNTAKIRQSRKYKRFCLMCRLCIFMCLSVNAYCPAVIWTLKKHGIYKCKN